MNIPAEQHLRKGVVHLLSGSIIGRGLNFILNLALSRALGPSALGIFSLILTTAQTFELTAQVGIDYGVSCALTGPGASKSRQEREKIAATGIRFVGFTSTLLAFALGVWIIHFDGLKLENNEISRSLLAAGVVGISLLESLGSLPWVLFLIQGETRLVALRQGLFAPARLLLALVGGWFSAATGAIVGYAIMSSIQFVWVSRQCNRLFSMSRLTFFGLRQCWQLIRSGLPMYITNALAGLIFLPLLADVASVAGIADVGYLRIGQMVVQLFTLLPGALAPLLFFKLRSSNKRQDQIQASATSLRLIWCLGLVTLVIYLVIDHTIVRLLFGEVFLQSVQPTRVLVLCAVLDSASQVLHTPLLANRRTTLFTISQNSGAAIAAILGFTLIPTQGISGYLVAKFAYSVIPISIYSIDYFKRIENRSLIVQLLVATSIITPACWQTSLTLQMQALLITTTLSLAIYCSWPLRRLLKAS